MSDLPQTETLDQLYLEWSQFTRARTQRELRAKASLIKIAFQMPHRDVREITQEEWLRLYNALVQVVAEL